MDLCVHDCEMSGQLSTSEIFNEDFETSFYLRSKIATPDKLTSSIQFTPISATTLPVQHTISIHFLKFDKVRTEN